MQGPIAMPNYLAERRRGARAFHDMDRLGCRRVNYETAQVRGPATGWRAHKRCLHRLDMHRFVSAKQWTDVLSHLEDRQPIADGQVNYP